jgi:hypothetical protein
MAHSPIHPILSNKKKRKKSVDTSHGSQSSLEIQPSKKPLLKALNALQHVAGALWRSED